MLWVPGTKVFEVNGEDIWGFSLKSLPKGDKVREISQVRK